LSAHSFADVLHQLRTARGLSLPQLAEAANYTRGYLWEIETGRKSASADAAARLDQVLQAGGRLLAALQQPDGDDVKRRQVLVELGVLGLAIPLAGAEAVRHGLTAALGGSDEDDIDEWTEIAEEYARSFYYTSPTRLLRDLTVDLDVLARSIPGSVAPTARGLSRVGGQLAAISAMAWASAGEMRHARRWWRTARRASDRSGDLPTQVWVRGWEVTDGLYEQRPMPQILDRAAEATALAGRLPSAGTAGLYAGLAQTLAVAGRREEAIAALSRVADITDRLPALVLADEESMFGWPEVRLRHTESYVYAALGDTTRAYAAQDQALALYPGALARERAAMLLHRAGCMIRDGDVSGGLVYAGTVLDDLPTEQHTDLVYAVARAALATLPETERRRRDVKELTGRLALPAGRAG
jgi:transcriptional regulator with XRE-family HTH domain